MSRSRPLAPSEQKRFLSIEEISTVEGLVSHLSDIIQAENPVFRKDPVAQPKSLATLVLQLQLFMDEVLGEKSSPEERFAVKIPAAFFRDFAHPNGVLKHMLVWALEFRQSQLQQEAGSCRRFELMAGELADTQEDATHIIFPDTVIDHADTEFYFRAIEHRGSKLFVHWWYRPDSYDSWIMATSGGSTSDTALSPAIVPEGGQWKLGVEWLRLLERYNEWMNEGDFEITQAGVSEVDDKAPGTPQRKPAQAPGRSKRGRRRLAEESPTDHRPMAITTETVVKPEFRLRFSSSANLTGVSSLSENDAPIRRKRDRPSTALFVDSPSIPASTSPLPAATISSDLGSDTHRVSEGSSSTTTTTAVVRKKSKLDTTQYQSDHELLSKGSLVISLNGLVVPNPNDKTVYDGLKSCFITSFSELLESSINAERSATKKVSLAEPLSDSDSISKKRAKEILAGRQQEEKLVLPVESGRPPTNTGSAGSSVVSRRRKTTTATGPASPPSSPLPTTVPTSRQLVPDMISSQSVSGSIGTDPTAIPQPAEPEQIYPGVLRYPPRSLQHSISNTPPKELFNVIRSINPLDPNYDTTILSLLAEKRHLTHRVGSAEAALRTMMLMWTAKTKPDTATYSFGLSGGVKELPDVPPITLNGDSTDHPRPPPEWLISSTNHLSDFERQQLEQRIETGLSDHIDMLEETGMTLTEASHIPLVLPTSAKWFSLTKIHPVEKEQLGSFFFGTDSITDDKSLSTHDSNSLEKQYMTIRNAIIHRYRVNPLRYLSMVHCRQFIDGDAALLLRIHAFLDYWGLINFQALPHTFPSRSRRPIDFRLRLPLHAGKKSDTKDPFPKSESCVSKQSIGDTQRKQHPSSRLGCLSNTPTGTVQCVACGKLCLYSYFVLKPGNVSGVSLGLIHRAAWCLRCYANGRYPDVLSQRQFVKVTIPLSISSCGDPNEPNHWTNNETEKLIEGIELYSESWEAVAKHVGTRSPLECVSHFIRLPLEDPLISTISYTGHDESYSGDIDDHQKNNFKSVFSEAPNPLLTQFNFLQALLGPDVAAAAAKAACDVLIQKMDHLILSNSKPSRQPLEHDKIERIIDSPPFKSNGTIDPTETKDKESLEKYDTDLEMKSLADDVDESSILGSKSICSTLTSTTTLPLVDQPVTSQDIATATRKALETAATIAQEKARQEESKICQLIKKLNTLKEKQLEAKIRQFYLNERSMDQATQAVEAKLEDYFRIRDDLRTQLATANQENQKVVADYHRERQQKQQQQFHHQVLQHQMHQQLQQQQIQHQQFQIQQQQQRQGMPYPQLHHHGSTPSHDMIGIVAPPVATTNTSSQHQQQLLFTTSTPVASTVHCTKPPPPPPPSVVPSPNP